MLDKNYKQIDSKDKIIISKLTTNLFHQLIINLNEESKFG
jgi:hypothetical protein